MGLREEDDPPRLKMLVIWNNRPNFTMAEGIGACRDEHYSWVYARKTGGHVRPPVWLKEWF